MRTSTAPIDVALARAQHRAYAAALAEAGVALTVLPTDEGCPDAVFVEDTAVLLGPEALITVPGAPSRRPEVPAIAAALAEAMPTVTMALPATLDGGDVLRSGSTLYVGLSGRTNREGLDALAALAARHGIRVIGVPVAAGLHLKSAVTLAAEGLLVAVADTLDLAPFHTAGDGVIEVAEQSGGNVLALGSTVLVSADAPETAALLAGRGLQVRVLDVSELHKGDGALTCLSLRQPPPGAWCA